MCTYYKHAFCFFSKTCNIFKMLKKDLTKVPQDAGRKNVLGLFVSLGCGWHLINDYQKLRMNHKSITSGAFSKRRHPPPRPVQRIPSNFTDFDGLITELPFLLERCIGLVCYYLVEHSILVYRRFLSGYLSFGILFHRVQFNRHFKDVY